MQTQEVEPKLNKRERYKARLKPIDYFKEFEDLDFGNLAEGDRFFLQDFGIFTTDFLEDEFTIRLRIAAGKLTHEQFSYIADVVAEYDLTVITTARGGLQKMCLISGKSLTLTVLQHGRALAITSEIL